MQQRERAMKKEKRGIGFNFRVDFNLDVIYFLDWIVFKWVYHVIS